MGGPAEQGPAKGGVWRRGCPKKKVDHPLTGEGGRNLKDMVIDILEGQWVKNFLRRGGDQLLGENLLEMVLGVLEGQMVTTFFFWDGACERHGRWRRRGGGVQIEWLLTPEIAGSFTGNARGESSFVTTAALVAAATCIVTGRPSEAQKSKKIGTVTPRSAPSKNA